MLLRIEDHKKLGAIQETFSECYPHLRLLFYDGHENYNRNNPADELWDAGDIRNIHDPVLLELKSWLQYEEVKQIFKKQAGMLVRIFRISRQKETELEKNDKLAPLPGNDHESNTSSQNDADDEEIRLDLPL